MNKINTRFNSEESAYLIARVSTHENNFDASYFAEIYDCLKEFMVRHKWVEKNYNTCISWNRFDWVTFSKLVCNKINSAFVNKLAIIASTDAEIPLLNNSIQQHKSVENIRDNYQEFSGEFLF